MLPCPFLFSYLFSFILSLSPRQTEQWTCLSTAVSASGGPTPRSCHKICLDRRRGLIYTLGGYVDPEHRLNQPMPCDFYVYDIERARWTCLSKDVAADGGPGLIYDHQMCYHGGRDSIYVFGGRYAHRHGWPTHPR